MHSIHSCASICEALHSPHVQKHTRKHQSTTFQLIIVWWKTFRCFEKTQLRQRTRQFTSVVHFVLGFLMNPRWYTGWVTLAFFMFQQQIVHQNWSSMKFINLLFVKRLPVHLCPWFFSFTHSHIYSLGSFRFDACATRMPSLSCPPIPVAMWLLECIGARTKCSATNHLI